MVEVKDRPKTRGDHSGGKGHAIRSVGVIGAGQMGNGIAHVCALSGFQVLLNDVVAERISEGIAIISGNLARQVSRQRITEEEREAAIKRITPAKALADLANCDMVIEAATEKEEVKRKIFTALCPSLKPETIVGTNTSSISITRLAAATDRPGAFHRHSFHESGAADGAGRNHPRYRHRRRDLRDDQAVHQPISASKSRCRRISLPSSSTASCCR